MIAQEQLTKPQRIQLRRTKGWRMPPNTVKVDRSTKWGNPFRGQSAEVLVERYRREHIGGLSPAARKAFLREVDAELRGKNLACWCTPGRPCHADFLLEIVNR